MLADAGADVVSALTLTNTAEAIGVVRAAADGASRRCVSFTVETDGNLPTGMTLADTIAEVDDSTDARRLYLVNCAHPDHFTPVLDARRPRSRPAARREGQRLPTRPRRAGRG